MTKTRNEQLVHPATTYRGYINGAQSSTNTIASFQYLAWEETISYANSRKLKFNSCTHERIIRTPNVQFKTWTVLGQPTWLNTGDTLSGDLTPWGVNAPGFPVPAASFWLDNSFRAMDLLLPSLSKGAPTLVNFLLELRDLKKMFDLWDKYRRGKLLNAVNLHLNVSFGWLPTIGDLKQIINGLVNFEKRWNKYVSSQGKVQHSRVRFSVRDLNLPVSTTTYPYGAANGYKRFDYAWEEPPVYVASLKYSYSLPKLKGLSKLRGMLDTLGVKLDPKIIWDAIPYTFVLDWSVGIGQFLHQFSTDNVPARVVQLDFCHSLKYSARCNLIAAMGATPIEYLSWSTRIKRYYRRAEKPCTFRSSPDVRVPGFREAALAVSLVLSRVVPGIPQRNFRDNPKRARSTSSYNWDRALNNGPRWQNGKNFRGGIQR
jgi:hypothetical protein